MEPTRRVEPLAIPAQQAPHGKRVTQAVQAWRRHAVGDGQLEAHHQMVEDQAGCARVDAAAPAETEQWGIGARRPYCSPALNLLGHQPGTNGSQSCS